MIIVILWKQKYIICVIIQSVINFSYVQTKYKGAFTTVITVCIGLVTVIPKVRFDAPEVYDVDDSALSLRWNTVDVPAFSASQEPLLFIIERQTLPSHDWTPIAENIADRSYRVAGLEPYRDYNFRVRGVYPSGYTEPSPQVPVYRRPSESRLGIYGVARPLVATSPSTHTYVSGLSDTYVRKPRYVSPSPHRRYTLSNIFEFEQYEPEQWKAPTQIPEPKFKREDAYVYRRSRSPSKLVESSPIIQIPTTQPKPKKSKVDQKYDLYTWYLQHRRFSDAGLDELRRLQTRSRKDQMYEQQRRDLLQEAHRPLPPRRASVSPRPPSSYVHGEVSDPWLKYPSVADRYEDIKTPYIMDKGHWKFARRYSVALDYEDYQRIKKMQEENRRLVEIRSKSMKPTIKKDIGLISQTQEEYFGGAYFSEVRHGDYRQTFHKRSLSQERDPGYFMVSKFSLAVSGVRKSKPTRSESVSRERYSARPASLEPSPFVRRSTYSSVSPDRGYWSQTRSMTPDSYDFGRARLSTPDMEEIRRNLQQRSDSLAREFGKPTQRFRRSSIAYSRSSVERSPVRLPSPVRATPTKVSRAPEIYIKPRSYSVSVPAGERRFNRAMEDSKTLVKNYETLDHKSSEQLTQSRAQSITRELGNDPRFSVSRRSSAASRPSVPPELRSDPRFTSTPRGSMNSMTLTPSERSRSTSTHSLDPRFARRRSSMAVSTNEDLKSKIDTITSKLASHKKKSSRPVMKFKSSRGEGYVMEDDWEPKSAKLSSLYQQLT